MTSAQIAPKPTALRPLLGQLALITGSTSGIGLGIARALAGAGANVVLNGFGSPDEIATTIAALEKLDVTVEHDPADLLSEQGAAAMVDSAVKRHGRIDILVNNAGIQHVSPIESFPIDRWDAIQALNLGAAFHTIRAAMPSMKAARSGRIINIASAHGLVASPHKSAYVAAKHGVLGLTKTVALEAAREGVTCNAICPGYVWTTLVEKQVADTARTRGLTEKQVIEDVLLAAQPSKRFATVEEVGALALFLASPLAASINGAAIPIDGGWTAQ